MATCFACGKTMRPKQREYRVTCRDDQTVHVGYSCYATIRASGKDGYQPPKGGPRLWTLENDPKKGA